MNEQCWVTVTEWAVLSESKLPTSKSHSTQEWDIHFSESDLQHVHKNLWKIPTSLNNNNKASKSARNSSENREELLNTITEITFTLSGSTLVTTEPSNRGVWTPTQYPLVESMPGGLVSGDHQRPQTTPTTPTTKKAQNEDFRRWSGQLSSLTYSPVDFRRWSGWLLSLTYSAGTEQGWLCLHWSLELQQQWRWTHWATDAIRQCIDFHSPADCKTVLNVISKVFPPTALVCLQTFWIAWPNSEDACQVCQVREWKWGKRVKWSGNDTYAIACFAIFTPTTTKIGCSMENSASASQPVKRILSTKLL